LQAVADKLEFTGERFTPDCTREIRYEHFHRYALAADWASGLHVLDAACGEGYGSFLLAAKARQVTGVDISATAIAHARSCYAADNLKFVEADCSSMPFEDQDFDCIVSFETLEHLQDHQALLREFRRVLKPGGFLVISSPDKAIYTDRMGNDNPFHVKELYQPEFELLLGGYFPVIHWLGQSLGFHSMIWPQQPASNERFCLHQESGNAINRLTQPANDPVYLLAVCANSSADLPAIDQALFLFDDAQQSVYQHYNHEIRHNLAAGEVLRDLEARLERLQDELAVARRSVQEQIPNPQTQSWFSGLINRLRGRAD
jgi:ubiquinone/menaquinone biosynthesis C-methylase UbiE